MAEPEKGGKSQSAAAASLRPHPDAEPAAAPQRNDGPRPSHSAQAATSAQAAFDAQRRALEAGENKDNRNEGLVALPQGGFMRVTDYLDHEYIAEDHSAIFADPNRYMANPNPDSMYVWAAKSDPHTYARIRSTMYRPVEKEELREDTDLPIETHKTAGGLELVACYDVVLLEVPAKAVKKLYKWREMQAVLRTQTNLPFQQLRDRIERDTRGLATVTGSLQVE